MQAPEYILKLSAIKFICNLLVDQNIIQFLFGYDYADKIFSLILDNFNQIRNQFYQMDELNF